MRSVFTYDSPHLAYASAIAFRSSLFSSAEISHSCSHFSTSALVRPNRSKSSFEAASPSRFLYTGRRRLERRGITLNRLDNLGEMFVCL